MRRVTASRLPIIEACPASWALPHAVEEAGEPAQRGSAIHAFLAAVHTKGRDAALEAVPEEYRAACEVIDVERLPTHLAVEVAYAYDPERGSAREIGRDTGRDYSAARPGEIAGTADLVGLDGSDTVVIYDYKSGWSNQVAAREHAQLRALALMAARTHGASAARIGIIRLWESGVATYDVAELDAVDLDEVELELGRTLYEVRAAEHAIEQGRIPDTRPGPHCRYCPAAATCPSQTALVRQAVAAPAELDAMIGIALTPEIAARAYERIREVRAVIGRVEAQIYAMASREPIDLGGGKFLGLRTSERESIDGDKAMPLLRQSFGAEIAEAACEAKITKTRLRDALRIYATKTGAKLAQVEREAMAALRAEGAVEVKRSETIGEYDAA